MLDIKSLSDSIDDSHGSSANQTHQPPKLIITKMTSGVKDPNRVNIFIDNKFAFSLDINQVVDLHIKVGKQLDKFTLQELHSASEFGKLYQRALEWVLTRPHSVWETRDYLKRRQLKRIQLNRKRTHDELKPLPEISNSTIDLVLERLIERGYVDDHKFAEFYIENRFVKKGISRRRITQELHQKHVPENIITEILSNSPRDELTELKKMITKKSKRYNTEKLIRYLINQGFNYQLVKDTVAEMCLSES